MKKDKKWAQKEVDRYLSYEGVNAARNALAFAKGVINQLDEPEITLDKAFETVAESYSMTKEEIWRHLERLEAHGGKVTYDEPEVLSQEWIDENKVARINNLRKMTMNDVVSVDKLKKLLVPKQEEVDRAYKDGYEKGKQHETEKKPEETETVAKVLVE